MTKKMLMLGLLFFLVFALNGCQSDTKPTADRTDDISVPSFSECTEESEPEAPEQTQRTDMPAESTESAIAQEPAEEITVVPETDTPQIDNPPKVNEPENTEQPETQPIREESAPPQESKPTEAAPTETEEPEPIQVPEPDFDITHWVEFSKTYAQSISLTLDSTATECWDNPITANPSRTNLQEDIISRLNRYKNVEGFTAVWIWAEKVSDTEYELYIGYA